MTNVNNKRCHSLSCQSWWRKSGAGFTLLELLVTIAITGILTAMMFTNFSKEKDRNNLKAAVRQVQTDLQAMQTNAQAGLVQGTTVPYGYGVYISNVGAEYITFADQSLVTPSYVPTYQPGESLQTRTLPGNTDITFITPTGFPLNIVFTKPNGKAVITANGSSATSATLRLKSTRLNICYDIVVTANVGTVSSRQLTSCTP